MDAAAAERREEAEECERKRSSKNPHENPNRKQQDSITTNKQMETTAIAINVHILATPLPRISAKTNHLRVNWS
jgi:hypothetical protein